ncbi:hypothetical protein ABFS82_06G085500 [Erythranthe guttata]|nr:PREDICTED: pentatricopeptide repeat-containing protein At4g02750-like [Erythranthe guttata]|eukprot:XP_012858083.1 PREDICTED: pentatricopeptide repeat-containing protein At4g02750-like [Erythranthe guttata]
MTMKPLVVLTQKISQLSLRGQIADARKIFDQMSVRDSVSWNVMTRCYIENNLIDDARELFDEMPERTSVSWSTMIMGYAKAGKTHIAHKLFVVMPDKDVVSWTAMVTALFHASRVDDAWRLFTQMPFPNAVSWSSVVSGFQQQGFANQSFHAFKEMLCTGIQPNSHSFTSILSACADLSMATVSEQVFSQLLKRGFQSDTHVANSAISTFFKTGNFNDARLVFSEMDKPDRVTWNSMIMGFSQHGYGLEATMLFHQMQKARFLPDSISYVGVLHGCSHCGFLEEGIRYFNSMIRDSGISPGVEHFSTMVDLYARGGKIEEAYRLMVAMPFEPTIVFWRALLSGCMTNRDLGLGVYAAEKMLEIEPVSSSGCLMAVNVFALAGKWDDVAETRKRMREEGGGRKELGCSWIDIKGRNYLFSRGDLIHSEADQFLPIVDLLVYDIATYFLTMEESLDGLD